MLNPSKFRKNIFDLTSFKTYLNKAKELLLSEYSSKWNWNNGLYDHVVVTGNVKQIFTFQSTVTSKYPHCGGPPSGSRAGQLLQEHLEPQGYHNHQAALTGSKSSVHHHLTSHGEHTQCGVRVWTWHGHQLVSSC